MGCMQNCLMASVWNADPDQRSVIHPASLWNVFFELCSLTLKLNVLVFCWKKERSLTFRTSLYMKPSIYSPHRNMLLIRRDSDTTQKATKSVCGENHAHTNTQTHNSTHIFSLFVSGWEKESEIDERIKNKRNRKALKRKKPNVCENNSSLSRRPHAITHTHKPTRLNVHTNISLHEKHWLCSCPRLWKSPVGPLNCLHISTYHFCGLAVIPFSLAHRSTGSLQIYITEVLWKFCEGHPNLKWSRHRLPAMYKYTESCFWTHLWAPVTHAMGT